MSCTPVPTVPLHIVHSVSKCVHAQEEGMGQPPSSVCQPWCIPIVLISIWEASEALDVGHPGCIKNPGVQGTVRGNRSTFLVAPELITVSCWILFVVCVSAGFVHSSYIPL